MKTLILTTALALGVTPALAQQTAPQPTKGGSQSSTPTTGDVSASTYGSGTSTPDSVAVSGGGTANAGNGGTASTDSTARFNENTARQRSVATARDDDERARSRTTTRVQRDGDVRSKSMSIYKQRGEKPVIDRQSTTTPPQ
jgi:hypothetical protein